MTVDATLLLAALFVAHFLGDFTPLSGRSLGGAEEVAGLRLSYLVAHGGVHAALVAAATLLAASPGLATASTAGLAVGVTHAGVDAARSGIARRWPSAGCADEPLFWRVLGLDQLLHALVLVGVARSVVG